MEIVIAMVLTAAGFVLLIKGADFFVDGASGAAFRLGIPQLIVGLTIVAMGTSLPEAAVSISAALKGSAAITVGNVVGSNILNILVILGAAAVITSVRVADSTIRCEIPFMLGISLVFLYFGYTGNEINFIEGILLWVLFLVYLGYLLYMAKKNHGEEGTEKPRSVWMLLLLIAGGLAMIVFGSNLTVEGATAIARRLGVSERFIGLTIVALGTSLPELVTSVTAAVKGKADIAIGNIVGSNIFNILFVVGSSALITPVVFAAQFIIDTLVAVGAGVLLWLGVFRTRSLNRPVGIIMLLAYAAYFLYLL